MTKEKKEKKKQIKIGENYYFDTHYQQIFCNNIPIKLSKRELQLLKILLNARGNIVPFDEIEYAIWDDHVSDGALRILIYRLRQKLSHDIIETFPSFGCKLVIEEN